MTVPALALAPVLTDRTGAAVRIRPLDVQLLERAARDDYDRWLSTALQAGGCVQPIRLSGTVTDIDATTGEILHDLDTEVLPDKVIYVPCGDRRESVCPPCAETYRADT
ncbi:MAG TPA: replication initiator, partial [Streptosporangiaceae bacterium]|nr:replication initiator [Streptosporangiaceae bacterium]